MMVRVLMLRAFSWFDSLGEEYDRPQPQEACFFNMGDATMHAGSSGEAGLHMEECRVLFQALCYPGRCW
jgi:hypothetical protein